MCLFTEEDQGVGKLLFQSYNPLNTVPDGCVKYVDRRPSTLSLRA